MRINKECQKLIVTLLFNLGGGLLSFFGAMLGEEGRAVNFVLLLFIYIIAFLCMNNKDKVFFLIVSIWQYTIMMEAIYRFVRYEKTPFETYFIFDILGIIFLFIMLKKLIQTGLRDGAVICLLLICAVGTFSTVINSGNFVDYLSALRIVIRYLGIYLYFCTNKFEVPSWGKWFIYASFIAFAVEVLLDVNVDFRNGLFGYEYTGGLFSLLLVIWSAGSLIQCINGKKRMMDFGVKFVITEICLIMMESKAEIILYGLWVVIIFVIYRSRSQKGQVRRLMGAMVAALGLSAVWSVFVSYFSKFTSLSGSNIFDAIALRLQRSEMMQESSFTLLSDYFVEYDWQKIFGVGMGTSIPPRYFYWIINTGKDADELFNILKFSEIFDSHRLYYKFFASGYNVLRLDIGYLGTAIFFVMLILIALRAIKICRAGKSEFTSIVGVIGVWQVISLVFRVVNNNIIVQHLPMALSFALFGIIYFESNQLKKKDSNQ
ncbi:MAG: hypothetical protein IJE43_23960 [Alphaproteobacteria bacterium]|nr:hypothetical protein [Alphaproteobacteria bacterium]